MLEPRTQLADACRSGSRELDALPLVTLYLSERCNSRCVTCDYWRHGVKDMTLAQVERLLPALEARRTRTIVLSGGEPLINPQWSEIAALLKSRGLGLWLLTSGLALAKHARSAADLFQSVTVSLDGTSAQTYAAIRGLDAFDKVCEGIDKAGDFVDEKTGGQYGDKIDQGVSTAKDQLDNLDGQNDDIPDNQP